MDGHVNLPAINLPALVVEDYPEGVEGAMPNPDVMDDAFHRQFTEVNRQLTGVNRQLAVIGVSLRNSDIRQQNGFCATASDPLIPLANLTTGEEIQPFPATAGDLQRWTGPQMRTVLQALGAQLPARITSDALRRMLRAKIGLRHEKVDAA
ncbi:MAG: hypothetical protein M1826_005544 [Phylliscum demangeonii]|nr:MAG: hypothetical protein M1826_005544 [Phylliscum demangeonii]